MTLATPPFRKKISGLMRAKFEVRIQWRRSWGPAGSTDPHFWERGCAQLYDFDPPLFAEIVVYNSPKLSVSSTKCFWQLTIFLEFLLSSVYRILF